jgi:hypothetical protein
MTLSGVGFSGSGCGDLTWTKLEAEGIRQSETCAVPDFAMADSRGFAVQRPWGTSGKAAEQSSFRVCGRTAVLKKGLGS